MTLADRYGIGAELWSATSYKRLREDGLSAERFNRLHPLESARVAPVSERLRAAPGPIVAVTDYMKSVPDQIERFIPPLESTQKKVTTVQPRPYITLGTDGFGRSDTRAALRRFFETDEAHIVIAVLSGLAQLGSIEPIVVDKAIKEYGVDADVADPWTR